MKKYGWLMAATLAAAALIWGVSAAVRARMPVVTTTTLQYQTVEQTVQCTGKVEAATGDTQAVAAAGKRVQIRAAVPESRLRQVAVGQRVRVTGTAFGGDGYAGRVASLSADAHATQSGGTVVEAVIELDAADPTLRCGLTAQVGICVDRVEQALLLPYDCLRQDDAGEEYVYLLQDGYAVRRTVETGGELADGVLAISGVQEGDVVIQNPDDIRSDGERVRVY